MHIFDMRNRFSKVKIFPLVCLCENVKTYPMLYEQKDFLNIRIIHFIYTGQQIYDIKLSVECYSVGKVNENI